VSGSAGRIENRDATRDFSTGEYKDTTPVQAYYNRLRIMHNDVGANASNISLNAFGNPDCTGASTFIWSGPNGGYVKLNG